MTLYYVCPSLGLDMHSPDFSYGVNMYCAGEVKGNKYPAVCLLAVCPGRTSSLQKSLGFLLRVERSRVCAKQTSLFSLHSQESKTFIVDTEITWFFICLFVIFTRMCNLMRVKIIPSSRGKQRIFSPKCTGSFLNVHVQGMFFGTQNPHP